MSENNPIKAIETQYNGYRFRSRLEARWAVFFDTFGAKYRYEDQGYQLPDGTRYLPDFIVEGRLVVEVKGVDRQLLVWPQGAVWPEIEKARAFAQTKRNVIVCAGEIVPAMTVWSLGMAEGEGVTPARWSECPLCRSLSFALSVRAPGKSPLICLNPECAPRLAVLIRPSGPDPRQSKRIEEALLAARQARFEHGESGAPR